MQQYKQPWGKWSQQWRRHAGNEKLSRNSDDSAKLCWYWKCMRWGWHWNCCRFDRYCELKQFKIHGARFNFTGGRDAAAQAELHFMSGGNTEPQDLSLGGGDRAKEGSWTHKTNCNLYCNGMFHITVMWIHIIHIIKFVKYNSQVGEKVYLNLSLEAGKPVHYFIYWDDNTTYTFDENGKKNFFQIMLIIIKFKPLMLHHRQFGINMQNQKIIIW